MRYAPNAIAASPSIPNTSNRPATKQTAAQSMFHVEHFKTSKEAYAPCACDKPLAPKYILKVSAFSPQAQKSLASTQLSRVGGIYPEMIDLQHLDLAGEYTFSTETP